MDTEIIPLLEGRPDNMRKKKVVEVKDNPFTVDWNGVIPESVVQMGMAPIGISEMKDLLYNVYTRGEADGMRKTHAKQ